MLDGLDALVIDLQDVGVRIYTYIYTMANCLRACGRHGVHGRSSATARTRSAACAVEGPMLEPGFESFVGLFPIPMRHGMTIGELARLFNERFALGADLEVIPMEGWSRGLLRRRPTVPWVMPSPNIPTLDTAIVYPGRVLFEGTLLSEGRGTTRPFELIGAPWIHAERFAACAECARARRRLLPPGRVRADIPEARQNDVRRLPDPRDRPRHVQPVRGRRGVAPRVLPREPGAVRVAAATCDQYDAPRCRSTSSLALRCSASRSKDSCRSRTSSRAGRRVSEFDEIRAEFLLYRGSEPGATLSLGPSVMALGGRRARADLVGVVVRVDGVDLQPARSHVGARLRVRPLPLPLLGRQPIENFRRRFARGLEGGQRGLDGAIVEQPCAYSSWS